jgi:hypothetical protein
MNNPEFAGRLAALINTAVKEGIDPHQIIGTLAVQQASLSGQLLRAVAMAMAKEQAGGILPAKVMPRKIDFGGGQ